MSGQEQKPAEPGMVNIHRWDGSQWPVVATIEWDGIDALSDIAVEGADTVPNEVIGEILGYLKAGEGEGVLTNADYSWDIFDKDEDEDGDEDGDEWEWGEEDQLAAAAPDLLQALKELYCWAKPRFSPNDNTARHLDDLCSKAIAKAEAQSDEA